MPQQRIGYDKVSELDMRDIRNVRGADLEAYFRNIAQQATAAQLRAFLYGTSISETAVEDDPYEKDDLEDRFVARRCETVNRLREGASSFDAIIDGLS